jgi:hypothetical protein
VDWDSATGFSPQSAYGYVPVRPDGHIPTGQVQWVREVQIGDDGLRIVGQSLVGRVAVCSDEGQTVIRDLVNERQVEIGFGVDYAVCEDLAEKLIAVRTERVSIGEEGRRLRDIIVLGYDGSVVYESGWTDCDISRIRLSWDGNLLWYGLTGCMESGEFLVRIDKDQVLQLGPVPSGIKSLSTDGRSMLIYCNARIRALDLSDPAHPSELWVQSLGDRIAYAAISDQMAFACYVLASEAPNYREVFVVATDDGKPVGRLLAGDGAVLNAPLTFVGPFLFAGSNLLTPGLPLTTHCICVFDLRALALRGK